MRKVECRRIDAPAAKMDLENIDLFVVQRQVDKKDLVEANLTRADFQDSR